MIRLPQSLLDAARDFSLNIRFELDKATGAIHVWVTKDRFEAAARNNYNQFKFELGTDESTILRGVYDAFGYA